jgi:hypothetical protein
VKNGDASEILAEIYTWVGEDRLLLSWPCQTKGTRRRWKHLSLAQSKLPAYQQMLVETCARGGNIGVALGPVSNGLVALDFDDPHGLIEDFISKDPRLKTTFRTFGQRGGQLFFQMRGWYPLKSKTFKFPDGRVFCEFRSGGNQSIVWGIHTSGQPYQQFNGPVLEIGYEELPWPPDLIRPREKGDPDAETPEKKPRGRPPKPPPWSHKYKGDLCTLDVKGLFKELGLGELTLISEEERKYEVGRCPWEHEHTERASSDTVVWLRKGQQPVFFCAHRHCEGRTMEQVLEWAERKCPGIVDRYCRASRVWEEGSTNGRGLLRVLHPNERVESQVYRELGQAISPHHVLFARTDEIARVRLIETGFEYSSGESKFTKTARSAGFQAIDAFQAKSIIEGYVEPGILRKSFDQWEFVPKSFITDFCRGLIKAEQFKGELPVIRRILTVPIPLGVDNGTLVYPQEGYDQRFETFLTPGGTKIQPVELAKAKETFDWLLKDFCFTGPQSKTHAIARLLTPFARGLLGWTTRTPCWYFTANRPRAGKDFLAGLVLIVYEGHAFEDLPIGKESEEIAKRIMAAARAGRRFMHFSNCQGHLQDPYFIQAITNRVLRGRALGSNSAAADLEIPSEIEFSISANIGCTYRVDLEERFRKIELAYFEEDPNDRVFSDKFLHQTVTKRRAEILSAIASVFSHWVTQGCPKGETSLITYPEWAEVIGGVMMAAGLGNPCLKFESDYTEGSGDFKEEAMKALFQVCSNLYPEQWIDKKQIYGAIEAVQDQEEALRWFGQLSEIHTVSFGLGVDVRPDPKQKDSVLNNQQRLGKLLRQWKGRESYGIKLDIDQSQANTGRWQYRFRKVRSMSVS